MTARIKARHYTCCMYGGNNGAEIVQLMC